MLAALGRARPPSRALSGIPCGCAMSALQIDKTTGELFAQGDVDEYPGKAVEPVTDSSRYNDFDINLTLIAMTSTSI